MASKGWFWIPRIKVLKMDKPCLITANDITLIVDRKLILAAYKIAQLQLHSLLMI